MYKLECSNISKSFDGIKILEDISINVQTNEVIAILGVSGSGKTTLFNIISGLIAPDSGRILIEDADCTAKTGRLSYMQQDDLLLPWKSVTENVILPLTLKGMKKAEAKHSVEEKLRNFGLYEYRNALPRQISGGMAKRASLLRAYCASSDIMLLDEPFSSLDMATKMAMYEWLKGMIKSLSLSVLLITHDIDEAIFLADRIYILGENPEKGARSIREEIAIPPSGDSYKTAVKTHTALKETITSLLF